MAIVSKAFEALVTSTLGFLPLGIGSAISTLSADERDRFTVAWLNASDAQREAPATAWIIPEEDRPDFEKFRLSMNGLVI